MPRGSTSTSPKSYRELRTELDALLAQLQDPECDIDTATKLYEAALKCIGQLEQHLQEAENRITKVRADDLAGSVGD